MRNNVRKNYTKTIALNVQEKIKTITFFECVCMYEERNPVKHFGRKIIKKSHHQQMNKKRRAMQPQQYEYK